MSREFLAGLTINEKKLEVKYRYRCSNDDAGYQSWTKTLNSVEDLQKEKRIIFDSLLGGLLVFNFSCASKSHYAYLRAVEYFKNKYNAHITDLWWSEYDKVHVFSKEETERIKEKMFKVFDDHLSKPIPKEKYYVVMGTGRYLYRLKQNGCYSYTYVGKKLFSTVQALHMKYMYGAKEMILAE